MIVQMFRFTVAPVMIGCLLWACARDETPVEDDINVVLISIDTLRADHLSLYGYDRKTSPNLEKFALESTLFKRPYAQSHFTLTSHMSMMTSLFPLSHGVNTEARISHNIPTLAEMLDEEGYRTGGFYAQKWLDPKFGFGRGFDVYEDYDFGDDGLEATSHFLDEWAKARENPFFLFLHFRDVHTSPFTNSPGFLYDSPPEFRDAFLPYPELSKPFLTKDVWNQKTRINEKELANLVARYDGGILYVDSLIGRLLEKLRALGAYDQSIIMITSDHGESLGDRGRLSGHGGFFEEGLKVPLIVKLPESHPEAKRFRGQTLDYPVQSVDLAPTVLNVVGIESPAIFQGKDLFSDSERDVVAFKYNTSVTSTDPADPSKRGRMNAGWASLIRGDRKLRMVITPGGPPKVRLFDLRLDPGEENSLHSEDKSGADAMTAALEKRLEEHRELFDELADETNTAVELEPEKIERLKAMGYLE